MMKVIFLDIDGVLNNHRFLKSAQSCTIDQRCVQQLTRIIKATSAKIVLSSAWRYMIHGGAMTLDGFGYMLRTHGFLNLAEKLIIDLTISDETCWSCEHEHTHHRPMERGWHDDHHRGRTGFGLRIAAIRSARPQPARECFGRGTPVALRRFGCAPGCAQP